MPSVKQRCDEWWLWWRCSPTVGVWSQTQQWCNGKDQRVHQQTHRSSSSQPRREPEAESEAPLVPVLQRKAASVSVRLHSQAQTLLMSVIHAVIDGQCDSFHRPILTEQFSMWRVCKKGRNSALFRPNYPSVLLQTQVCVQTNTQPSKVYSTWWCASTQTLEGFSLRHGLCGRDSRITRRWWWR